MIKRKLIRLKEADEKRIIGENTGLYERIAAENFSHKPAPLKKPKKRAIWLIPVAGSMAAVALFAVVAIGVFNFGSTHLKKSDFMRNDANAPLEDAAGNDALPGGNSHEHEMNNAFDEAGESIGAEHNPITGGLVAEEITLSEVEAELADSTLKTDGLRLKSISAYKAKENTEFFELKADSFHTFDMIVQLSSESPYDFVGGGAITVTNKHGFKVDYSMDAYNVDGCYSYRTKATVYTRSETYYITYNYNSTSPECELLELIEYCITPKA